MRDTDAGGRGPKGAALKIDTDFEDAVRKAMQAPKPVGGWPDSAKRKRGQKAKQPPEDG